MLVVNLKFHLQANKNRNYQERVLTLFRALAEFLDERGFSKRSLASAINRDPWSFSVDSDDLTEDGMGWVREHLDKWFGKMDRRKAKHAFEDYLLALRDTLK